MAEARKGDVLFRAQDAETVEVAGKVYHSRSTDAGVYTVTTVTPLPDLDAEYDVSVYVTAEVLVWHERDEYEIGFIEGDVIIFDGNGRDSMEWFEDKRSYLIDRGVDIDDLIEAQAEKITAKVLEG